MFKKKFTIPLVALAVASNLALASAATFYGDLNEDGSVDSIDHAILNRHILSIKSLTDTTRADLNGDGSVDSTDFALSKRFLLGIIPKFPVEDMVTPSPTPTSQPTGEEWKENTGTIVLGNVISTTGKGISVNGTTVSITSGGDHEVSGALSDGMILVDTTEKVKLRLSGVNITNSNGPAIYFKATDKSYITLTENTVNYLTDGSTYADEEAKAALFSNDDLEIKGKGTLNITSKFKHGICSDDDVVIENGKISINTVSDGVHTNGSIKITGGTLNITSGKDGLQSEDKEITIDGGNLNISAQSQGITSDTGVVINNGTTIITESSQGIKSPVVTINGGTVAIHSASMEVATDNAGFAINGGVYIVAGSSNIVKKYPAAPSTQYTIASSFTSLQNGDTTICVKDSTGKELVVFKPKRNFQALVFSSPELQKGSQYTIYAGGTASGGKDTNGLITGSTYSGGSSLATITVSDTPTTTN